MMHVRNAYFLVVKVNKWEGTNSYLTLKKTFINIKIPKSGKPPKTAAVGIATPKKEKGKDQPALEFEFDGFHDGISMAKDKKGNDCISVTSAAKPGCYWVNVKAKEGAPENETGFEVIVK